MIKIIKILPISKKKKKKNVFIYFYAKIVQVRSFDTAKRIIVTNFDLLFSRHPCRYILIVIVRRAEKKIVRINYTSHLGSFLSVNEEKMVTQLDIRFHDEKDERIISIIEIFPLKWARNSTEKRFLCNASFYGRFFSFYRTNNYKIIFQLKSPRRRREKKTLLEILCKGGAKWVFKFSQVQHKKMWLSKIKIHLNRSDATPFSSVVRK